MISFLTLLEQMSQSSPLMDSGEDSASMSIVRTGKQLRKDDETQFWDDFISLCSNADGLAELLEVSPQKIRSWPTKIKEVLDKLQTRTAEDPSEKQKDELLPTGETGAVTLNSDPLIR